MKLSDMDDVMKDDDDDDKEEQPALADEVEDLTIENRKTEIVP